jgi:biopolymer transport protein ExbB
LATKRTSAQLDGDLRDVEETVARSEEKGGAVADVLERGALALETAGLGAPAPLPEGAPSAQVAAAIDELFNKTRTLLAAGGAIERKPGTYFLADGTSVDGEIVRLGAVAAFGLSSSGSGALTSAGGGRLKLWPEPGTEVSAKVVAGEGAASSLSLVLFESLDKPVEPRRRLDFFQYTTVGGTIAWVIVAVGLFAALLIAGRTLILFRSGGVDPTLLGEVTRLVSSGQVRRAEGLLGKSSGAMARVLRAAVGNLHRERTAVEDAVNEAVLKEAVRLERFGTAIAVCVAVGPLLGLLGTVTGMIATFDIITEFGTGDPRMLSRGISEALITTEYGLKVAIPGLMVGSLLAGKADSLIAGIEQAAMRVINAARGIDDPDPTTGTPSEVPAPAEASPEVA